MSDPRLRDVLEPLNELRTLTPPRELGLQAIHLVRQTLAARRRRVVRFALVAYASAAALVVVGLSLVDRSSAPVPAGPAPLAQLKQAVQSSNDFRGVVQIRLEEVQLDSQGQPQGPPKVAQVEVNTLGRGSLIREAELPDPMQQLAQRIRQAQAIQAPDRVDGTILIPLTWEGRTIPIPTNPVPTPPTLQPYTVGPDQAVTVLLKGYLQQYQIQPVAPQSLAKEHATVWVNPKTGLVDEVQLERTQDKWQQIQNYRYRYVPEEPSQQIPSPPSAAPKTN